MSGKPYRSGDTMPGSPVATPSGGGSGAHTLPVRNRVPRALWILPVVTFLAGLVLGGVLVGIGDEDGGDDAAGGAAAGETSVESAAPSPSPAAGDATVTVPRSCLDAMAYSEELLALGQRTSDAMSEFDVGALQGIAGDMSALQPVLREAAERCRADAAQQ